MNLFQRNVRIGTKLLFKEGSLPFYRTIESSRFVLNSCLVPGTEYVLISEDNEIEDKIIPENRTIKIPSGYRALVPIGLFFAIPESYAIKLFSTRKLSLLHNVNILNEGISVDSSDDSDIFVPLENRSHADYILNDNVAVCEGELVKTNIAIFQEMNETDSQL